VGGNDEVGGCSGDSANPAKQTRTVIAPSRGGDDVGALCEEPPSQSQPRHAVKHPKTLLQELMHQGDFGAPQYVITAGMESGPCTVEVRLGGEALGVATGADFRLASAAAAVAVLEQLGAMQDMQDREGTASEAARGSSSDSRGEPELQPVEQMDAAPEPAVGGRPPEVGGAGDKGEVLETATRSEGGGAKHPKTMLQELVHNHAQLGKLSFALVEDSGVGRPSRFQFAVVVGGREIARARGPNQKVATTEAAKQAYALLYQELSVPRVVGTKT